MSLGTAANMVGMSAPTPLNGPLKIEGMKPVIGAG